MVLSLETRRAAAELTRGIQEIRPLAGAMEVPPRVAPADRNGLQRVLDRVTSHLTAPPLELAPRKTLGTFDRVVSARLGLDRLAGPLVLGGALDRPDEVAEVVDATLAGDFDTYCEHATVCADDGAPVPAYAAGDPDTPGVVLVSACGMPARLVEQWMRRLAVRNRVVTWESRALFGEVERFHGATDVDAQVRDLFAVMDHFGLPDAHVAGLCGGAVIALAAARSRAERVCSLSLWHGDFELAHHAPKTDHQRDLQTLMAMAAENRVSAGGVHAVLRQSMTATVPSDLAHLVLYPYATPELFFRYCQLNGSIMRADVAAGLSAIRQPTLVVTSEDDRTAHPDGSRYVAAALPDARLVVSGHGDHLALFRTESPLLTLAVRFILRGEI